MESDLTGHHYFVCNPLIDITEHVQIIFYTFSALLLEFCGAILRSFFGPLILIEVESQLVVAKFTDHYRLLLYSISEFFIGIALLYLFYTQGMLSKAQLLLQREQMRKTKEMFKDLTCLDDDPLSQFSDSNPKNGGKADDLTPNGSQKKRFDWESKILVTHETNFNI